MKVKTKYCKTGEIVYMHEIQIIKIIIEIMMKL